MKSIQPIANQEESYIKARVSPFNKLVYAVFVLNVLGFVVLLLGLLAGWFGIDGDRMTDGTYRLGLVFDIEEVGDDIGATMNAAGNLTETAKSATALETYDGKIKRIDVATNQIVLTSAGKDYDVRLTDATEFDSKSMTSINDLQVGEPIRLTVQEKDDQLFAVKVKEEASEAPKN